MSSVKNRNFAEEILWVKNATIMSKNFVGWGHIGFGVDHVSLCVGAGVVMAVYCVHNIY